jgi:hypothetical protein
MICSAGNSDRLIVRPFSGANSSHFWRSFRGSRQREQQGRRDRRDLGAAETGGDRHPRAGQDRGDSDLVIASTIVLSTGS